MQRHFLLHGSLPGVKVPVLKSFVPFFFYLLPYLILRRLACLFGTLDNVLLFRRCSVGIVPWADVFLTLWGGR